MYYADEEEPIINNHPGLTDSYDWMHIFKEYVGAPAHVRTKQTVDRVYTLNHVAKVLGRSEGENDGDDWVGLFEMDDGKFIAVNAGCDYTGWGCQESGSSSISDSLADAIAFGLTQEHIARLTAHDADVILTFPEYRSS